MSSMSRPIRVLCVDDHPVILDAFSRLFAGEDFILVGSLTSADDLLSVARQSAPDIVLLDIIMPGPDPFAAIEDLRRQLPEVRVIVYSGYVRDHYIDAAVCSGAWGYAYKGDPIEELLSGMKSVAQGTFFFSAGLMERAKHQGPVWRGDTSSRQVLRSLTVREQEILRLIGRGLSRAEIARTLARSPNTITGHTHAIMKKLAISSRVGLVRYAIAEGLAEASQA
jgi:DNA-binding NarL/FixJ family response regulator